MHALSCVSISFFKIPIFLFPPTIYPGAALTRKLLAAEVVSPEEHRSYLAERTVREMTTWKIIRIYLIPADTRREAQALFADAVKSGKEDAYFQTVFVKKVEEEQGWIAGIKNQMFGKRK